jgi:hypothetical protein
VELRSVPGGTLNEVSVETIWCRTVVAKSWRVEISSVQDAPDSPLQESVGDVGIPGLLLGGDRSTGAGGGPTRTDRLGAQFQEPECKAPLPLAYMVTMPVSGGAENVKAMLYGVLIAPAWVSSESRS